jgi:hypothetical protein
MAKRNIGAVVVAGGELGLSLSWRNILSENMVLRKIFWPKR